MNSHYTTEEYRNALNKSIEADKEKVRAIVIDPDALVNSIYDVLAGKKPLYDGMDFSEAESDYFVEYAPNDEWEPLT